MMEQRLNKIGIMGGTFNPIHNGHLAIAEDVRNSFGLDRVLFIPSGQPPHKPDSEVIDAERRFEMVRRAVAGFGYFEASRLEVDRNGPTYTVNTLSELKKHYGNGTSLYFIIGADVIPELTTWKDFRRVFEMCAFIAVLRPGYDRAGFGDGIEQMKREYGALIYEVSVRQIDVSSTQIRERCGRGEPIDGLVPAEVEKYILAEGLYRKLL